MGLSDAVMVTFTNFQFYVCVCGIIGIICIFVFAYRYQNLENEKKAMEEKIRQLRYTCPKCNAELDGSPKYCPECGTKLRVELSE